MKAWDVGIPPSDTNVLPSGVTLNLKRDSDGHPARFRAHLVVQGNLQDNWFDFGELFAPLACIETVRIILAVTLVKGWVLQNLNVKGSFLYAQRPGTEEVLIELPSFQGVPE